MGWLSSATNRTHKSCHRIGMSFVCMARVCCFLRPWTMSACKLRLGGVSMCMSTRSCEESWAGSRPLSCVKRSVGPGTHSSY